MNEFISGMAKQYELDEIVSSELIHQNIGQDIYLVATKEKEYIVRILKDVDDRQLSNEIIIQAAAEKAGIAVGRIISQSLGDYVYENQDIKATIAHKVEGASPTRPISEADAFIIGRSLGEVHSRIDPDLPLRNDFLFVGLPRLNERLAMIDNAVLRAHLRSLIEESSLWGKGLPEGVVHGDLHCQNVLLKDDKCTIIDLQSSGRGPYILDIGRSIADVCSFNSELNPRAVQSFLAGYQTQRPLSGLEKAALTKSIVYGAVCVAIWGYQYQKKLLGDEFLDLAEAVYNGSDSLNSQYLV